jgi:hypothetical protein
MIQPINLSTSYNSFKSANVSRARRNPQNNSRVAMYNAIGISATAGGLTTLVARSYTNSFANAGVLGLFGAFLTMFFMTPHLIEKINMEKAVTKKYLAEPQVTKSSKNATKVIKEHIVPVKKLVQFRSDKTPTS